MKKTFYFVLSALCGFAMVAQAQVAVKPADLGNGRKLVFSHPLPTNLTAAPNNLDAYYGKLSSMQLTDAPPSPMSPIFLSASPATGDTLDYTWQEIMSATTTRPTLCVEGAHTHIIYMRSYDTLTIHSRSEQYLVYNGNTNTYTASNAVRDTSNNKRIGFGMVTYAPAAGNLPFIATHESDALSVGFSTANDDSTGSIDWTNYNRITTGLDPSLAVNSSASAGLFVTSGPSPNRDSHNFGVYDAINQTTIDTQFLKASYLSPSFATTSWLSLGVEANVLNGSYNANNSEFYMVGTAGVNRGDGKGNVVISNTGTTADSDVAIFMAHTTNNGSAWTMRKIMYGYGSHSATEYTSQAGTQLSFYAPLFVPIINTTTGTQYYTSCASRAVVDNQGIVHVFAQAAVTDSLRDSLTSGGQHITILNGNYPCLVYWNSADSIWREIEDPTLARDPSYDSIMLHLNHYPGGQWGFARPAISMSPDGQTIVLVWEQPKYVLPGTAGSYQPDASPTGAVRMDIVARASTDGGNTWGPLKNITNLAGNSSSPGPNQNSVEEPSTADYLSGTAGSYKLNLMYMATTQPGDATERPLTSGPAAVVFRQVAVSDILNDIHEGSAAAIDGYSLSQNYPNPYSLTDGATNISYRVPAGQNATLRVFDMLGNQVSNLALGRSTGETDMVSFKANGLPTGVYRYQIETANGFRLSRQMVIVR